MCVCFVCKVVNLVVSQFEWLLQFFFALQSRYVAVSFSQSPGRGLTLYEDIV